MISENVLSADNQQERPVIFVEKQKFKWESSETTRRSPLERKIIISYLDGAIHDASLNKSKRIRFVQKYREWLVVLQDFLKKIGYNSWIYKEGKTRDLWVLETLCTDLSFTTDLLLLETKEEKVAYIKGFFDAEGGIPRNGKRFYIQLSQKNLKKIKALKSTLENLGINCGKIHNPSFRVDSDYWRVFVSSDSYLKFAQEIGSYHPIKLKIFRQRMKI